MTQPHSSYLRRVPQNCTILTLHAYWSTQGKIATKRAKAITVVNFNIYKPKLNNDFEKDKKFKCYSIQYQSIFLLMKKSSKSEELAEIYSNKLKYIAYETIYNAFYRRKIRSNITRNTQKQKTNVYISFYCRARIHRSVLRNCFTLLSAALLYWFLLLINRRTRKIITRFNWNNLNKRIV